MGGWLALTISNWKIAALLIAAFVLGMMRLRMGWLDASLQRARSERDALAGYRDTRKEIDHAHYGNDPDVARRWLHERGEQDRP
jgi:hypothetical protein